MSPCRQVVEDIDGLVKPILKGMTGSRAATSAACWVSSSNQNHIAVSQNSWLFPVHSAVAKFSSRKQQSFCLSKA